MLFLYPLSLYAFPFAGIILRMAGPMIQARGLGKIYRSRRGSVTAVEALDLTVEAGEIFGLLGPNGAGKTTTVRMLCGLIRPTSGNAWIDGIPLAERPDEARALIGLVPEDAGDHKNLSLLEELDYYGALYGLERSVVRRRSEELLARLGLADRAKDRLKTFSKGMRRKFHLVRSLLHEPRILLLDEPTAGLDPAISETVWSLLKSLATERKVSVIICSHHLEEVERLCGRVGILKRRLLAEGTLNQLSGADRRYRIELNGDAEGFVEIVRQVAGVERVEDEGKLLRMTLSTAADDVTPRIVRSSWRPARALCRL